MLVAKTEKWDEKLKEGKKEWLEKARDGGCCQPLSVTREEEEDEEADKWTQGASLDKIETEKERESERREKNLMD